MATLGRVPVVGDIVPTDGWTARVLDMDGHRVDRVRLERDEPGAAPDAVETDDDADADTAEVDIDARDERGQS
jgi:hypothetical protein